MNDIRHGLALQSSKFHFLIIVARDGSIAKASSGPQSLDRKSRMLSENFCAIFPASKRSRRCEAHDGITVNQESQDTIKVPASRSHGPTYDEASTADRQTCSIA